MESEGCVEEPGGDRFLTMGAVSSRRVINTLAALRRPRRRDARLGIAMDGFSPLTTIHSGFHLFAVLVDAQW